MHCLQLPSHLQCRSLYLTRNAQRQRRAAPHATCRLPQPFYPPIGAGELSTHRHSTTCYTRPKSSQVRLLRQIARGLSVRRDPIWQSSCYFSISNSVPLVCFRIAHVFSSINSLILKNQRIRWNFKYSTRNNIRSVGMYNTIIKRLLLL